MARKYAMTVGQNGTIRVPARAQSRHGIGYNDEVKMDIITENDEDLEGVIVKGYVNSSMQITIPARVRRNHGIESGDQPRVSFERTGKAWSADTPTDTRGGNHADFR